MSLPRTLALIPMAALLAVATAAQSKVVSPAPYQYFRVGNPANVRVSPCNTLK